MIFALALMISSMVYSLSRGGFMALLGGSILALVIRLPRSRWSTQGRIVLLTLVTAVGLVSCFGYDRVVTRLGTFQEGLMSRGGRLAIWSRALPLVRNFPLWGSGYGTYQFVDVLHRSDALDAGMIVDHAQQRLPGGACGGRPGPVPPRRGGHGLSLPARLRGRPPP